MFGVVVKALPIAHCFGSQLIDFLNTLEGSTRIIMEHTGRYYEPVAQWLTDAGFFVSTVNPKLIKNYGYNSLRKVKTDKRDAMLIAKCLAFHTYHPVHIPTPEEEQVKEFIRNISEGIPFSDGDLFKPAE